MRCWFFRSIDTGPMAVSSFIRFLAGSTWPCGVLISTSSTSVVNCRSSSRSRTMIGNSLPPWRKVAACVPDTLVRIVLATVVALTPNKRGLGPIDTHRQLGAAVVAAEAGVGNARHRVEQVLGGLGDALRLHDVLAADFERQPAAAAEAAAAAAREEAIHLVVAARRVRPDDHARDPGELAAQIERNLLARAGPLVLRREDQLDVAAVAAAAAAARVRRSEAAAARARVHDHVGRFGHELPDHLLDPVEHRRRHLDARAAGQLHVHLHLALVGLRRELGRQLRIDQHRRHDRRGAQADHGRPVRERQVENLLVAVVHPFEHALAHPVELRADAAALIRGRREHQQPRAEDRHQRHRDEERHRQREARRRSTAAGT